MKHPNISSRNLSRLYAVVLFFTLMGNVSIFSYGFKSFYLIIFEIIY